MASYYTNDDNKRIPKGYDVIRNAPQPTSETADSLYWPATKFNSKQINNLVERSWAHGVFQLSVFLWIWRLYRTSSNTTGVVGGYFQSRFSGIPEYTINVNQGGDTRKARFITTSFAKARAASTYQIMYLVNYTQSEIDADTYVAAGGYASGDIYTMDALEQNATTIFTQNCGNASNPNEFWAATDIVWLPTARLSDIPGTQIIEIDFETQDGGDRTEVTNWITHVAGLIQAKGHKISLWLNPLSSAGAAYSGIDAVNANQILQVVDYFTILVSRSDNDTSILDGLDAAWAMLTAGGSVDPSKIVIGYSLGNPNTFDTTERDARRVQRWAKTRGITKFNFWRNSAVPGSPDPNDSVNRELNVLALQSNVTRPHTQKRFF